MQTLRRLIPVRQETARILRAQDEIQLREGILGKRFADMAE